MLRQEKTQTRVCLTLIRPSCHRSAWPLKTKPMGPMTAGQSIPAGMKAIHLIGTEGSDFLLGYDGDDLADGGAGDDQVEGGDGDDTLSGGADDDTLHGQYGHDLLQGDDGDDDLYGHYGDDTLIGGAGEDSLVGGQGNDVLDGGADADALHGYHGDDTLVGDEGADTLFGGIGNDLISGLTAEGTEDGATDYLNGGDGDDQIVAGAGDVITSGDGADTVRLSGGIGTGDAAEIMDFEVGEDSLLIEYDAAGPTPDIEVIPDEDDTEAYRVMMDGVEVALVHSPGGLNAGDLALVPQGTI